MNTGRVSKRLPVLLFSLLVIFHTAPAFADDSIITIDKAVEIALDNNGELKAVREEKGFFEASIIKAGLYPNPVFETEGAYAGVSDNNFSVGISQEITTGGKRRKQIQVADKDMESYGYSVNDRERKLIQDVRSAFLDVLLAESRVRLAGKTVELDRQLVDIANERFEAGDIPELDVNLAKVELARREESEIEALSALGQAKAKLLTLMGLPSGSAITFSGTLDKVYVGQGLDDLTVLALQKRTDLAALAIGNKKAEAEIDLARAEMIPDMTVSITYQRDKSSIENNTTELRSTDNFVGLKLSVPIPLFDRNQAGLKEAVTKKTIAAVQYDFLKQNIVREVKAAYARLEFSQKTVAIYGDKIIPQLDENLQLIQEAYRLGEVGTLNVIEEQKKYFEINEGYLASLYEMNSVFVQLESAVGERLSGGEK